MNPIFAPPASASKADADAFERLVGPYRSGLQAHCYRMLGSATDAEDALQETLLRAWRGMAGFEGRSAVSSWLYRIATNVCLRMIERRPKRVLPFDAGADPLWLEPYPDIALGPELPDARYEQRESIELAFTAALQHLPPRQRAVLLLRDVLGFSPAEIAEALEASPAAIYSALQRARAAVEQRLPARSQQATLRELGDAKLRAIVDRYVRAWEAGDVAAITAMLTADATFAMPPIPEFYVGAEAIGAFLAGVPILEPGRWRHRVITANGQAALAVYKVDGERALAHGIELFELTPEGRISAVLTFLYDVPCERFGLPRWIPAAARI